MNMTRNQFWEAAKTIGGVGLIVAFFGGLAVAEMEKTRENDLKDALLKGWDSITFPGGDTYRIVCTEPGMANGHKLKIFGGVAAVETDETLSWASVPARDRCGKPNAAVTAAPHAG